MKTALALTILVAAATASANLNYHALGAGNLIQNWDDPSLITIDNDWAAVPSITGYAGSDPTASFEDPQTILGEFFDEHVYANQPGMPGIIAGGGVAEFDQKLLPNFDDRTVALQGLGTADFPHLRILVDASGLTDIHIRYTLRDIDDSPDNVQSQVALHYRFGPTGIWTNVPTAYVPDASSPGTATQITHVDASLAAWNNQPQLEFRIMLANAQGTDEWIGVDNIEVGIVPEPATIITLTLGAILIKRRLRR